MIEQQSSPGGYLFVAPSHEDQTADLARVLLLRTIQMNVKLVVVTDVHSWIGGHGPHETERRLGANTATTTGNTADYGDVLSFVERLQEIAETKTKTTTIHEDEVVFFLNNGDFMDGTGLSTVPPRHLLPLLKKMPFDAINVGNHELYHNETIYLMQRSGFIEHWNGNYLSSNTLDATTGEPLGNRYTFLTKSA